MAYETGTWLTPSDGLDKIRVFLLAQGWTVDAFTVEAPGKRLHMHKGAFYLNMKSADSAVSNIWPNTYSGNGIQIGFNVGTGYTPANAWRDQPGVVATAAGLSIGGAIQLPAGAVTSYRFDYDDSYKSLVIYVQTQPGVWRWGGFGESLLKAGAWTGGAWIAASSNYYTVAYATGAGHTNAASAYPFGANSDSVIYMNPLVFVRADVDAYTGKWVSCSPTDSTGKAGDTCLRGGAPVGANTPSFTTLLDRARNSMNSLSVLLPVQVFAVRDAGGVSLLGTLPNVFVTNISGMVPGQSYQQGVDWFTPFSGDTATRGTVIKRV